MTWARGEIFQVDLIMKIVHLKALMKHDIAGPKTLNISLLLHLSKKFEAASYHRELISSPCMRDSRRVRSGKYALSPLMTILLNIRKYRMTMRRLGNVDGLARTLAFHYY